MEFLEAQKKASKKYFDSNYRQIKISMPVLEAEELEKHCQDKAYTKADFIRAAIKEKIKREKDDT